jgi:hypothetical protein
MSQGLSAEIIRFVLTSVPSVPYLEALLLIRAEPARGWTSADIARRLYLSEKNARELIDELIVAGIATAIYGETLHVRYQPIDDSLRERLDQLAQAYSIHLIEVTRLIHSKADRNAQHFADAFKWRKED